MLSKGIIILIRWFTFPFGLGNINKTHLNSFDGVFPLINPNKSNSLFYLITPNILASFPYIIVFIYTRTPILFCRIY